jgi:hypothetical protein
MTTPASLQRPRSPPLEALRTTVKLPTRVRRELSSSTAAITTAETPARGRDTPTGRDRSSHLSSFSGRIVSGSPNIAFAGSDV